MDLLVLLGSALPTSKHLSSLLYGLLGRCGSVSIFMVATLALFIRFVTDHIVPPILLSFLHFRLQSVHVLGDIWWLQWCADVFVIAVCPFGWLASLSTTFPFWVSRGEPALHSLLCLLFQRSGLHPCEQSRLLFCQPPSSVSGISCHQLSPLGLLNFSSAGSTYPCGLLCGFSPVTPSVPCAFQVALLWFSVY